MSPLQALRARVPAGALRTLPVVVGVGVLGASRALGVARGTVQSRLDKLVARGVIRSFAPQLDPVGLGYPVMAFSTLEIRQGTRDGQVMEHLRTVPEVLEAHTITGSGDVMIRVVARDNGDLQRVIDLIESWWFRTGPRVALHEELNETVADWLDQHVRAQAS